VRAGRTSSDWRSGATIDVAPSLLHRCGQVDMGVHEHTQVWCGGCGVWYGCSGGQGGDRDCTMCVLSSGWGGDRGGMRQCNAHIVLLDGGQ